MLFPDISNAEAAIRVDAVFGVKFVRERLVVVQDVGQLFLLASSCLYKLNRVLVVAFCLVVGAVFGHVNRA